MAEPRNAYLGLGANLGNREKTLRMAVERLTAEEGVTLCAVSSLYETMPWGKTDQPLFLNAVAAVKTTLTPEALLLHTQTVEAGLGRVRHERWGPRTVDIDILHIEGVERCATELTLPHAYMTERAFVLVPLAEIAPKLVVNGRMVEAWRDAADTGSVKRITGPDWIRR